MGREAKILLGFLGLLAGIFVGVLSMKLLVPRPPAGAGPDIRADVAAVGASLDVVEPPVLSSAPSGFTEAPPLFPDPVPSAPASEPTAFVTTPGGDRYADRASRFGDASTAAAAPLPAVATTVPLDSPPDRLPTRDPFVATAGFNKPAEEPPAPEGPEFVTDASAAEMEPAMSPSVAGDPAPPSRPATAAISAPEAPPAPVQTPRPAGYVVQPGDSWWTLAERAYGDGRFYRLLFVWNRTIDPRVSLVPGTTLQIPPLDVLAARWPGLVPR